jgi:hypothetical protein
MISSKGLFKRTKTHESNVFELLEEELMELS